MGSGIIICGVGRFFYVVGVGLVAGPTLKSGAGFQGDLEFWFLSVAVLSISALRSPHIFTLGGLYVLGCEF